MLEMDPANKQRHQHNQAKTAILFDAENISFRFADEAIALAKRYGKPIIRAYADFSRSHIKGWEEPALRHGIRTIHQFSYDGKNSSSDFLMMHDAFKLAHSGKINTFVIVTNDNDFITPIQLLRQSGTFVLGIGNTGKCSELLIQSCNEFSLLNEPDKIQPSPLAPKKQKNLQPQKKKKPQAQQLIAKKTVNKLINSYQGLAKEKGWVSVTLLRQNTEIQISKNKKFSTFLKETGHFQLGEKNSKAKLLS